MEHAGGLLVGDRAEVMANAVVARAVFRQFTSIGEDCRIGNLAFVSHNVRIGAEQFRRARQRGQRQRRDGRRSVDRARSHGGQQRDCRRPRPRQPGLDRGARRARRVLL